MKRQIAAGLVAVLISGTAAAHKWEIEITNVTPGQSFTPLLVATHYSRIDFFEPGEPASEALAMLAEAGATDPLREMLEEHKRLVGGIATTEGLLAPGETVKVEVRGWSGQRLSLAGMLVPTNDTFVAVDSVFLPLDGEATIEALAWDAGSELNDQNCLSMPGPRCGGEAYSPPAMSDEGFVYVSNGFHDLGEGDGMGEVLKPAHYTWNNPVAIVTIRRKR